MNAEAKKQLASQVVANVGGKENISSALHCMTRLRLNVKDKSRVNVDAISKLKGVIGAQWSGDQFQVIIGQEVGDVYKELVAQTGIASEAAVNENLDEKKKGFSFGAIIDAISGCLIPAIPIVTGAGMLKVVLIFATMFGWMGADSPTYQVLSFASDAGFYFLPVFIVNIPVILGPVFRIFKAICPECQGRAKITSQFRHRSPAFRSCKATLMHVKPGLFYSKPGFVVYLGR